MKKLLVLIIFISGAMLFYSFTDKAKGQPTSSALSDSLELDRIKYIKLVLAKIKGRENLPVDSVFHNLKIFKGMPAKNLLGIMNIAYSKSLGVSCGHCHNTNDFASDEKKEKDITRDMSAMNKRINEDLLKNIKGLQGSTAAINCTTCHRGEIKPALDIEEK
jgi:hypothetical protein